MSTKSIEESKKEIDSLNEILTYFAIDGIGGSIWHMHHERSHGRISDKEWEGILKDIERISKIQQYAISTLTRFGVITPFRDSEYEKASAQYWAWFRWWDSYIKNMKEEDWEVLDKKLSDKEDVSNYKPDGDWRDNVANEEEKIKRAEEFWSKVEK